MKDLSNPVKAAAELDDVDFNILAGRINLDYETLNQRINRSHDMLSRRMMFLLLYTCVQGLALSGLIIFVLIDKAPK